MEDPARMAGDPLPDLIFLVRRVGVENDVDGLVLGHFTLDPVEEAAELLMTMALHVLSDNRFVKQVERGEGLRAVRR